MQLDKKLQELGLNKHQLSAAIGTVIGRIIAPGSELATHYWLQHHTGLGELVGYDLTNTYFEGSGKYNNLAAHGHSKEKRTIVMDAGIATQDNINWLKENQYAYLVVSRKHHREFSEKDAVVVKTDKECTVKAYKKINDKTDEVELFCHFTRREDKENSIEHAVVLAKAGTIQPGDFPSSLKKERPVALENQKPSGMSIIENEEQLIQEALADCAGNKSAAAARLGISRSTLYEKLKKHHIRKPTLH